MVLIISDYHRREDKVIELIEKYQPDRIFNLGDSESEEMFLDNYNILSVKGNCDYINLPNIIKLNYYGINILMTHGHLYGVRYDLLRLKMLAKENNFNYVFYGHTHIQKLEIIDGILFLNPGSLINDHYALMDEKGNISLF